MRRFHRTRASIPTGSFQRRFKNSAAGIYQKNPVPQLLLLRPRSGFNPKKIMKGGNIKNKGIEERGNLISLGYPKWIISKEVQRNH